MKRFVLIIFLNCTNFVFAQDPHFSQFYATPIYMSPAQTMNTDADVRIMTDVHSQWINPAAPYITGYFSFENRFLKNRIDRNILGYSIGFMHDYTFDGILKSNYLTGSLAYHQFLDEDNLKKVFAGFGFTYGKKYLDFSRLIFAEQFSSNGFNTSLPSGESLSDMKAFLSLSAGLGYSYASEKLRLDVGASAFHLNNPKQTFLKDETQIIPKRYVGNTSLDLSMPNDDILNIGMVYQHQSNVDYWLGGINYGFNISGLYGKDHPNDGSVYLNIGGFYRLNDAVVPYVGLYINDFQFGFSADKTMSKLSLSRPRARTVEFSMSYRFKSSYEANASKCPHSPWR